MSEQYTVKSGDSLSKIAKEHNTTVDDLVKNNSINNANDIQIGQTLAIPEVTLYFEDNTGDPIEGLICKLTYCEKEVTLTTDADGKLPPITTNKPNQYIDVTVKQLDGSLKNIGKVKSGKQPKEVKAVSPKKLLKASTEKHKGPPGNSEARQKQPGPEKGKPSTTAARDPTGKPVAIFSGGAQKIEKSGAKWCKEFMHSIDPDELQSPFKENAKNFLNSMKAGGIHISISTTFRPFNRSYLMHYAAKITRGEIRPDKVPPKEGVNIDWAHRDTNGTSNIKSAIAAAQAMAAAYQTKHNPVALVSNHNYRKAIDMTIKSYEGKAIKDATGTLKTVKNWNDLVKIGATFGLFWFGAKDKVHWSFNGH